VNENRMYQVLLSPHVSEKTAMAAELSGRHTFKVARDATKLEIKRAVEKLFSVKVESVHVVNVKGKVKRFGAVLGRQDSWKKAIVKLKEGDDIDFVGLEGN